MELDRADARIEIRKIIDGQDSSVLLDCVLCYGCEEYCNRGNHLMFLISERPGLAARIKNKNFEDMAAAGAEVCPLFYG